MPKTMPEEIFQENLRPPQRSVGKREKCTYMQISSHLKKIFTSNFLLITSS
jgi:hypothetical protein